MNPLDIFRSSMGLFCVELLSCCAVWLAARAALPPGMGDIPAFFHAAGRWAEKNKAAAIGIAGALPILSRLVLLHWMPVPVPGVHDEFSYLLAGDTFASGRMTNAQSPFWMHFETFHELQLPSYASMYPPAQGLFLALGKILTGVPWAGVCLSSALCCAAACWMLQGWMSAGWAFFGGMLAIVRWALLGYWVNSYWGGSVVSLGAMLVLGSAPRLFRKKRWSTILCMTAGVLLLECSRPFEGLVFVTAVGLWCIYRARRLPASRVWRQTRLVAFPIAVLFLAGQALLLHYFSAVTGNPLRMPYILNEEQYLISRPFIWQKLQQEPAYHNPVMKTYYEADTNTRYKRLHTLSGFLAETGNKFRSLLLFYAWPGAVWLGVALFTLRRIPAALKLCCMAAGLLFIALCVEEWPMQFHYAAPMASLALLATMASLRALWRKRDLPRALRVGPTFLYTAASVAACALCVTASVERLPITSYGWVPWATEQNGNFERENVATALRRTPGRHLVFVHYDPQHDPSIEWVYNDADIPKSRVIWSRELSQKSDEEMAHYFSDRTIWEVYPDRQPAALVCRRGPEKQIVSSR